MTVRIERIADTGPDHAPFGFGQQRHARPVDQRRIDPDMRAGKGRQPVGAEFARTFEGDDHERPPGDVDGDINLVLARNIEGLGPDADEIEALARAFDAIFLKGAPGRLHLRQGIGKGHTHADTGEIDHTAFR